MRNRTGVRAVTQQHHSIRVSPKTHGGAVEGEGRPLGPALRARCFAAGRCTIRGGTGRQRADAVWSWLSAFEFSVTAIKAGRGVPPPAVPVVRRRHTGAGCAAEIPGLRARECGAPTSDRGCGARKSDWATTWIAAVRAFPGRPCGADPGGGRVCASKRDAETGSAAATPAVRRQSSSRRTPSALRSLGLRCASQTRMTSSLRFSVALTSRDR